MMDISVDAGLVENQKKRHRNTYLVVQVNIESVSPEDGMKFPHVWEDIAVVDTQAEAQKELRKRAKRYPRGSRFRFVRVCGGPFELDFELRSTPLLVRLPREKPDLGRPEDYELDADKARQQDEAINEEIAAREVLREATPSLFTEDEDEPSLPTGECPVSSG